jgi:hypothetical protein
MSHLNSRFRPGVEFLEQREVMTAGLVNHALPLTAPVTPHVNVTHAIVHDVAPTTNQSVPLVQLGGGAKAAAMASMPSCWTDGGGDGNGMLPGPNGVHLPGNQAWFGVNNAHTTWCGDIASLDYATTKTITADLKNGASTATLTADLNKAFPGQDVSRIVSDVQAVGWLQLSVANATGHGVTIDNVFGIRVVTSQ